MNLFTLNKTIIKNCNCELFFTSVKLKKHEQFFCRNTILMFRFFPNNTKLYMEKVYIYFFIKICNSNTLVAIILSTKHMQKIK